MHFSTVDMFQSIQLRFSPKEWANEMAELSSTPLPIMEVNGRPDIFSRMAAMVDNPGEEYSSEFNA